MYIIIGLKKKIYQKTLTLQSHWMIRNTILENETPKYCFSPLLVQVRD